MPAVPRLTPAPSVAGACLSLPPAQVPPGYAPPPAFATAALQHTRVKLTWDADDAVRKRALARRLTQDELHEDDFRARPAPQPWP